LIRGRNHELQSFPDARGTREHFHEADDSRWS
jgi:hypothetical protein